MAAEGPAPRPVLGGNEGGSGRSGPTTASAAVFRRRSPEHAGIRRDGPRSECAWGAGFLGEALCRTAGRASWPAAVRCAPSPPELPRESEREPSRRVSGPLSHEDPALPFLFPQGELLLLFSSNVVSDCAEIFVLIHQQILRFKRMNSFQVSFPSTRIIT